MTTDPKAWLDNVRARVEFTDRLHPERNQYASEKDRKTMVAALKAVLELHKPTEGIHYGTPVCSHRYCVDGALDQIPYPCPTVRAVTDHLPKENDRG